MNHAPSPAHYGAGPYPDHKTRHSDVLAHPKASQASATAPTFLIPALVGMSGLADRKVLKTKGPF